MRILATAVTIALSLAACAGTQINREAADVLFPVDQEKQLGQQVHAQVLQQYKPVTDENVQAYVQSVGERIVALDKDQLPQGITPHFTVLDSPEVNAFAIPGGEIFVFSGLLKAASNEAELASVLSHEMGHVIKRHVAQALVTQMGMQTLTSIALGQNAGALEQIGAAIATQGYLLSYSRSEEKQADEVGMQTMLHSQWDPHAMIQFFDVLAKQDKGGRFAAFLSNHPPPADRVQYLTQELQRAGNKTGVLNQSQYASIVSRLPAPAASTPATPKG